MGHRFSNRVQIRKLSDGKCHLRNEAAAAEIIKQLKINQYVAVLGSRHNQKSFLLNDVKRQLERNGKFVCVLVDLLNLREVDESDFPHQFAKEFELRLDRKGINVEKSPRSASVTTPAQLQHFLEQYARRIQKLVLMIDHLECIAIEPLKSILCTLLKLKAGLGSSLKIRVVATSSGTAELGYSNPSFLDVASPIWIRDMTLAESRKLIRFILRQAGAKSTNGAEQRLFDATKGDRYLLPILAQHCAVRAARSRGRELGEEQADRAVNWFVNRWAKRFAPLRGNVRAVARDTVALMNMLKILDKERVAGPDLMLDHKVDSFAFRLTGVVTAEKVNHETLYVIKNEFYKRYLNDNFRPEHVPHILSMSGGWEHAIHYLQRLVTEFPRYRAALLGRMVDYIRTAKNETAACDYLIAQASQAFALKKAKVYIVKPVGSHLRLQGRPIGFPGQKTEELPLQRSPAPKRSTAKDRPEVVAYKTQDFVVKTEKGNKHTIFVPLLRNDGRSLGVVAIYDLKGDIHEESFLELLAYFKRAGKAVGAVIDRERESLQLSTLNKTSQEVTRYLDKQKVAQATIDAAIESVPGAQRGVLFLWREKDERLHIEAVARPELFVTNPAEEIVLQKGEGYGGTVFAEEKSLRIGNVAEYPSLKYKDHPDIKKQKSVLCVPLKVWGRTIGVLFVDNIATPFAFNSNDERLLSTFAAQAAIALQNTQVYTELYELGLSINSGALDIPEIFLHTVQSITRISAAKAAHMLLLKDVDDDTISPSEKKLLSISVGLGSDYDEKVEPRRDGLAARVLKSRKYQAVERPEDPPGINRLAYKKGVRAYICLPLEGPTGIIGVLFVYYLEKHQFADNEIEMLSLFSTQAALAIENTRQRQKLEIMEGVTWMGIQFSDMTHSLRGELDSMQIAIGTLQDLVTTDIRATSPRLRKLSKYIDDAKAILKHAPLPFRPTPVAFELNAMLREVIPDWCPVDENIEIDFKGLEKSHITIKADRKLFAIVLKILTNNAVRAMRSAPRKRLIVSSLAAEGAAVVKITNSGNEIPAEIQDRLFKEPINKAPGASGTGVGLLIARSILLRSEGELKLDNSDQGETTFSFSLPLSRA